MVQLSTSLLAVTERSTATVTRSVTRTELAPRPVTETVTATHLAAGDVAETTQVSTLVITETERLPAETRFITSTELQVSTAAEGSGQLSSAQVRSGQVSSGRGSQAVSS